MNKISYSILSNCCCLLLLCFPLRSWVILLQAELKSFSYVVLKPSVLYDLLHGFKDFDNSTNVYFYGNVSLKFTTAMHCNYW